MSGRFKALALLPLALLQFGSQAVLGQNQAASSPGFATAGEADSVMIAGRLDGTADRIRFEAVSMTINGEPIALDKDGRFSSAIPRSDYYQLDIGGAAVFRMVQTFGGEELFEAGCNCLSVPDIELVGRKNGRIELFFGGDSMTGRRYLEENDGRRPLIEKASQQANLEALFKPMQPYFVKSDLASINLESVMADSTPGKSPPKIYVFFSPTSLARALRAAGIDYVTLGNNHTYDYMHVGLISTFDALNGAGIHYSGAGENIDRAAEAKRLDLGGNRLSLLGYVSFAGYYVPNHVATADKSGAMFGSMRNVGNGVRREEQAGRAVIMQLHGGYEFADEPNEGGVKRMRLAIDEGAQLVASHHPHVTQAIEVYKGRVIAYSLGNFMFDQNFIETMSSYVLKAWMENGKIFRVEVIPIHILDYRPVPAVGTMREASLRRLFALSARRDTHFSISGGHAVVRLRKDDRKSGDELTRLACRPDSTGIVRLRFGLAQDGNSCEPPPAGHFGRELLMRGDFENAVYGEAEDRNWGTFQASDEVRREASGNQFLSLRPTAAGQASVLFMRPYLRRLNSGRYSLLVDVRVKHPVTIDLSIKQKPGKDEKPTALWKGAASVGKVQLKPGPGWQTIRFDFNRTPAADKSWQLFRPILTFSYANGAAAGSAVIELDNASLVEWSETPESAQPPGERWFATHWTEK